MSDGALYETLEAFSSASPLGERRRRSGEVDFGVMWSPDRDRLGYTARVSWVEATGEVYVFYYDPHRELAVEVLGTRPSREAVEAALDGWAEQCGKPHSLSWVRMRLLDLPLLPVQHALSVDDVNKTACGLTIAAWAPLAAEITCMGCLEQPHREL